MSFKVLRYIVVGVVAMLCCVGCGYDSHEECELALSERSFTLHLSRLAEYAESGLQLPEGVVIEGRVTANDISENFYHSLVLEQDGVGVELRLALYDLHALYPVGCGVVVDIGGLAVERYKGALQVGRKGYGYSRGVEPIAPRSEILDRVAVSSLVAPVVAHSCTIATLDEEMCGTLVQIEGLQYVGEHEEWGDVAYGHDADRVFVDSAGGEIIVRTSSFAAFASESIPKGVVTLRGVLYCEQKSDGQHFILKLRDRDDVVRQ